MRVSFRADTRHIKKSREKWNMHELQLTHTDTTDTHTMSKSSPTNNEFICLIITTHLASIVLRYETRNKWIKKSEKNNNFLRFGTKAKWKANDRHTGCWAFQKKKNGSPASNAKSDIFGIFKWVRRRASPSTQRIKLSSCIWSHRSSHMRFDCEIAWNKCSLIVSPFFAHFPCTFIGHFDFCIQISIAIVSNKFKSFCFREQRNFSFHFLTGECTKWQRWWRVTRTQRASLTHFTSTWL